MLPLIPIISGLVSAVPSIAKWIGGDKAGEAAARVADIASIVTGIDDPKKATDAILSDPDMLLQFKIHMSSVETDLDKAYLVDRQNARLHHKHSKMPAILCIFLTTGLLLFMGGLFFIDIPEGNMRMLDMLFGSYLTAWIGSCAYWNGTTRGSAEKNTPINRG